jgi:hypothetical protein
MASTVSFRNRRHSSRSPALLPSVFGEENFKKTNNRLNGVPQHRGGHLPRGIVEASKLAPDALHSDRQSLPTRLRQARLALACNATAHEEEN